MSDRVETYDVTGVPSIEIAAQAGDIVIKPSDEPRVKIVLTGNAEAVDLTQVDASPESISIRSRHTKGRFFNKRVDMVINAPPGGYLKIDLASGSDQGSHTTSRARHHHRLRGHPCIRARWIGQDQGCIRGYIPQ